MPNVRIAAWMRSLAMKRRDCRRAGRCAQAPRCTAVGDGYGGSAAASGSRLRRRWRWVRRCWSVPACMAGRTPRIFRASCSRRRAAPTARACRPMVFEMVAKLEAAPAGKPDDADGWARLGRAYAVMERTDDALAAYERAYALAPDNATVLADYAWLLFNRDPGQTTGRVSELYTRLYKLDAQTRMHCGSSVLRPTSRASSARRPVLGAAAEAVAARGPGARAPAAGDRQRPHQGRTLVPVGGQAGTGTGRSAARFLWQRNWLRTPPVVL